MNIIFVVVGVFSYQFFVVNKLKQLKNEVIRSLQNFLFCPHDCLIVIWWTYSHRSQNDWEISWKCFVVYLTNSGLSERSIIVSIRCWSLGWISLILAGFAMISSESFQLKKKTVMHRDSSLIFLKTFTTAQKINSNR